MNKILTFILLILLLTGLFWASVTFDQPVVFADENFERVVREILNHYGKPIYRSQLLSIVRLNLSYQNVTDLSGIAYFRNVEVLNLYSNNVEDVRQLRTLTSLRELNLGRNQLVDLKAAGFDQLSHLELIELNLDQNQSVDENGKERRLSDISLLQNFTHLESLSLAENAIRDFSSLSGLKKLHTLNLAKNKIENIGFLAQLPQIRSLNLRENEINDISVLSNLVALEYLNLHSNKGIQTIRPLASLVNLEKLILRNVPIGDEITILLNFPKLSELNVRNCSISHYDVLARMMSEGILQDKDDMEILASINIRDNILPEDGTDPLNPLRPYWQNIAFRDPYQLPSLLVYVEVPEFSHKGGYYSNAFELALSVLDPQLEIYYTLDGSDPKIEHVESPPSPYQQTFLYSTPIPVESRIGQENVFSVIQTAFTGRPWLPQWYPPKGEVFKATVVRASAYDPTTGLMSDIFTQTYFVDKQIFARYPTLPVVSLVGDYDVLFHPDEGIYITDYYGAEFRLNRSRVPANIEYFDIGGSLGFQGGYEIALQGATSPASPQKGLHVFAGLWSSGEPFIDYPLFKNTESKANQLTRFKRFILRAWGSARDWPIFFADAYNQTLMANSDQDIQAYQPVVVFINGEYWGLHEMREANKNAWYYQAHYYGGKEMDFDLLDWGGDVVDEGDSDHWDALMNFLAANDISQSENYAFVKTQVDIENYIVYMIHCIYTGKTDWPGQNEYLWRPKTEGGIWRWAQYDMDQGLSPWAGPDQDFLAGILADDDLLLNILLGNAEFKQLFINYYADLMNTYFLTEVELAHFNDMVSELDPYMSEYQARWQLNQDWDDNKTFGFELLNRRWELRREQLIKNFGLSGSAKIELRVDPDMGNIAVNAILIDHDTPGVKDPSSWTGMYFKDVPIRVKAVPLPGFQFVRWESAVELDPFNPELVMILEEDISLRAIFSQIE